VRHELRHGGLVRQQAGELRIGEQIGDRPGLAVDVSGGADQAHAVAVVRIADPVHRAERLDRIAFAAMPAIDRDPTRHRQQPTGQHDVLLVACDQRA
jgi:hypothetical protein